MNFRAIFDQSEQIGRKAQAWQATGRDLAALAELYQQAIDQIDELIENQPGEAPLIARVDGQTSVKFQDAEAMARWITGVIHER